jgi:hypothetical protein
VFVVQGEYTSEIENPLFLWNVGLVAFSKSVTPNIAVLNTRYQRTIYNKEANDIQVAFNSLQ